MKAILNTVLVLLALAGFISAVVSTTVAAGIVGTLVWCIAALLLVHFNTDYTLNY